MKNYLDLVPISSKVHKRQNRMSVICIFLSLFLVASIFGMADMFIRCQMLKAKKDYGSYHICIKDITDEEAKLIAARPEIETMSCYGTLNYRLDMGYTLAGKELLIAGCDEDYITKIMLDAVTEGAFPQTKEQALVSENARNACNLKIGDTICFQDALGIQYDYTISGFARDTALNTSKDVYFIFLTTEAFRAAYPGVTDGTPRDYDSLFVVQFKDHGNIRETITDIKTQFQLSDEQVTENTMLLGLLGQSGNHFMMQIYFTAALLSVLVLLAGILMITGSLNCNIAGRTEFFGMLRCIGTTPKQIMRLVQREAFSLCFQAVPAGVAANVAAIWILCAVLRHLSPDYFGSMPAFAVSFPGIAAGIIISILTVFLASCSPAKRAAGVSPSAALSGHANDAAPMRKAANTALFKIDTALGIHHAKASRKNFLLMTGSFALSIILFLSFSVTIDFMKHAVNRLMPWTPDLSIISPTQECSVERSLLEELQKNPVVKRAYGRMFAYRIPFTLNGEEGLTDLISYEEIQTAWTADYVIDGAPETILERKNTGIAVYSPSNEYTSRLQAGDTVTLTVNGEHTEIEIAAVVAKCSFNTENGSEIIICSEDTFKEMTGLVNYTIIDVQLTGKAAEQDVNFIHDIAGENCTFSDNRLKNNDVSGTYYSFALFLYGFLALIALITIFNIINCAAMSVSARMKQYGALRAIGLSHRQLTKMIIAETISYTFTGSLLGSILGLFLNRLVYMKMVTIRWGTPWNIPFAELGIIIGIIAFSVVLAVRNPLRLIRSMSIVDTINAQ